MPKTPKSIAQMIVETADWRTRGEMTVASAAWHAHARLMAEAPDGSRVVQQYMHEFKESDPEPINLLPGLDIHFGWQYARLSWTEFERLVPDRTKRSGIEVTLANLGLRPDTQFTEEQLRYFQGRPTCLFDDPAKLALVQLSVDQFVSKYGSDKLKFEHRQCGKSLKSCSVYDVLGLLTMKRWKVDDLERRAGIGWASNYLAELENCAVEHGLWFGLVLTEPEQAIIQAWNAGRQG